MLCWQPQVPTLQFQSNISNASSRQDNYFQPCETHGNQISFICREDACRDSNNTMACNQCLINHKNHKWITKQDFLTPNIKNILTFQVAETDYLLVNTQQTLLSHLDKIQQEITIQFQLIKDTLQKSLERVKQKYRFKVDKTIGSSKVILNKMKLSKLMNIYDIQESKFEWIKVMEEDFIKISDKIYLSLTNLMHDLFNLSDAEKWEYKSQNVDEFKQFEKHLHHHTQNDYRYYLFSNTQKHMNIKINKELDEAIYIRAVPSKPVAIASQYITEVHSKFGFEIMKMQSKAIFFNSTIVYLGICSANIVKSFGYRKVNQFGKGSYLISSQGYAYHSTNEEFNNKELVGWGFGQGDIIIIQIIFDTDCIIKFTKKSRFFQNTFQMPLKLNEFQMNRLRPCVSFDSQEGAIVRIFDNDQNLATEEDEQS